jgi:uncharacterized membrane protein HdeD (DUF308 family)
MKQAELVSKETLTKLFLVVYFITTAVISYTAFYSPFIAGVYFPVLFGLYAVLWGASYYLLGWKWFKISWKKRWKDAGIRARLRKEVEREIEERIRNERYA